MEFGVAGWALHDEILNKKTLTQLELPGVCAHEFGVSEIELVSSFFPSQTAKYLNDLRQAIEDAGCHVRNIAVDMGNIAGNDPKVRKTDLAALKQWFYTAAAIGADSIRINTGNADPVTDEVIERVIDGYWELVSVGKETGVKLAVENHGGVSALPQNLKRIIDALDTPWFVTCPDTGNFASSGVDTLQGMKIMASRAYSCHIKVFSYNPDGTQHRMGRDGKVMEYNLKAALDIMREANYSGPYCIESGASATERESVKDAIKYVRELMS